MRLAMTLAGLALAAGTGVRAETVTLPVERAIAAKDQYTAQDVVQITLTPEGGRALAEFTRNRVGSMAHMYTDGKLLMSATLAGEINDGALQISSGMTGFGAGMSASELAVRLNASRVLEMSDEERPQAEGDGPRTKRAARKAGGNP